MTLQAIRPAEAYTIEVLHDAAQTREIVARLAGSIITRYADKDPLFVSLLKGGVVMSTQVMMEAVRQKPDFVPDVSYVDISAYGEETEAKKDPEIIAGLRPDVRAKGRLAVMLDDVLQSGESARVVEEYLYSLGVSAVELVTLVNKPVPRTSWENPTLYGVMGPKPDAWLVGMGMNKVPDGELEAYRFADYIAAVRQNDPTG